MLYMKSYFIIQRLRSHGTPDGKNGGNTFAFLPEIQEEGMPKLLTLQMWRNFREIAREHEFGKIVAHAPYTLNACAAKENLRDFARNTFSDDLKRMEATPEKLL